VKANDMDAPRGMARRFLPKYLWGVLCTFYLFTLGGLRARHRALIWQIGRHFGRDADPVPSRPPEAPLEAGAADGTDVHILAAAPRDGNVTVLETLILNRIARQRACRRLFEIGTFDGRTALNLAANAGDEGRVFTLDIPRQLLSTTGLAPLRQERRYIDKDAPGARFRGTPIESRITQLLGDSATFDFSPYRGTMDYVFVDGSHAYDYVLHDSRTALELVGRGPGIILWHDYGEWPEVTAALNRLQETDSAFRGLQHIGQTTLAVLSVGDAR
jgi:hypothetical protein